MMIRRQSRSERAFFTLLYYMVWLLGFGYGVRFLAASLNATDHIARWTNAEWVVIPAALASFMLLVGYLMHRALAIVVSDYE